MTVTITFDYDQQGTQVSVTANANGKPAASFTIDQQHREHWAYGKLATSGNQYTLEFTQRAQFEAWVRKLLC